MVVQNVPKPTIGRHGALVKVAACGLCRTDLEYLKGRVRPPKAPPFIPGHEASGTVVEVGKEVEHCKEGDKVIVAYLNPCENCLLCREGRENICHNAELIGATRDGAFAEFLSVPAKSVFLVPPGIPVEEASIITDAVASSFHALVNVARVKPGDVTAIYGASGGLGLSSIQIAKALGAQVIGIGRQSWKLERAKELGADAVISTADTDNLADEVRKISSGSVDISIDVSGVPALVEAAIKTTSPGGKIILLAFNFEKVQFSIGRLMWREQSILGSKNYRPVDMPQIIKLVEEGKVRLGPMISHRFALEEINTAYELLDQGKMLRGIIVP